MDASAGSSPPHSQENPPEHGGGGGDMAAEAPAAEEIGGGEAGADDFMFAEDTFPSLPDFPCLSSPSTSTFSSSSSSSNSNSSSAYTNTAGGGAASAAAGPSEPASAGEGFDALDDIDQLLDFASLSMPWDSDSEPSSLFPEVSMMLEDAMSAPPHAHPHPAMGGDDRHMREAKFIPPERTTTTGGGEEEPCMDAAAAAAGEGAVEEELPRFFMEWLTSNRENISAEDLRGIRLRRSTIEAAAARLGGGRQGTMQLLKLILTWVQNHHLQRKRPRDVMEDAAAAAAGLHGHGHGGQLPSPTGGANNNSPGPGFEFPAAGAHDMAATSWTTMPYHQHHHQQPFSPPAAYGGGDAVYQSTGAGGQQYTFHQSSTTSSVVVNSQPFSPPPTVADMHGGGGANIAACWPQHPQPQYVPFPGGVSASAGGSSYPMPPQPFSPTGFGGQYAAVNANHPTMAAAPQRMAGVEASATKEARKKRMARQRRLTCLQQQRSQQLNLGQIQQGGGSVVAHPQEPSPRSALSSPSSAAGGGGGWGSFWSPSGQQNPLSSKSNNSSRAPVQLSMEAAAALGGGRHDDSAHQQRLAAAASSDKRQQGGNNKADKNLRFLLQKVLKQSDVGSLGRIVLPKKEAEVHLPELKTRDGISIPMEDIGTSRVWNMRYRFWPSNKSRMYLLENTGEFVRSNELQEGDFIVIYSDVKSGKYLIRGVKVRPPSQEQGSGSSASTAGKHKPAVCPAGPEKASAPEDPSFDGSKLDSGACKGRSPQGVRRAGQGAAAMSQMAVSI